MILAAIDPGLDVTGVALFEIPPRPARADGLFAPTWLSAAEVTKAACCRRVLCLRTKPSEPLTDRLVTLANALRDTLDEAGADVVVIEVPTFAGAYRERRGRARGEAGDMTGAGLMGLNRAIGALLVGCAQSRARVVTVDPKGASKDVKRAFAVNTLQAARSTLKLTNQDAADAVFVGLTAPWDFADPVRTPRSA